MTEQELITFKVIPHIQFTCAFCSVSILARHSGEHHRSTSGHCPECGSWYIVEWATPIEFTTISMRPIWEEDR